jgi:hypothetical protein
MVSDSDVLKKRAERFRGELEDVNTNTSVKENSKRRPQFRKRRFEKKEDS